MYTHSFPEGLFLLIFWMCSHSLWTPNKVAENEYVVHKLSSWLLVLSKQHLHLHSFKLNDFDLVFLAGQNTNCCHWSLFHSRTTLLSSSEGSHTYYYFTISLLSTVSTISIFCGFTTLIWNHPPLHSLSKIISESSSIRSWQSARQKTAPEAEQEASEMAYSPGAKG